MALAGSFNDTGDDILPLQEIVFSCGVCQATPSELYATKESNRGFHSGSGDDDGTVVKLWIAECSHIVCGKHLPGGAAPFHPKDMPPKAPCPQCIEKGDDSPKDLYSIRGLGTGELDSRIPHSWLECPPVKLDGAVPAMEALRFQYMNMARFGRRVTHYWKDAQGKRQTMEAAYGKERKQRRQLQSEILDLKGRVRELEKGERQLEKWEARKPALNHYLGVVSEMAREMEDLRGQLSQLGFDVPTRSYSYDPESDQAAGAGVSDHLENGQRRQQSSSSAIAAILQHDHSSSSRKRKLAQCAPDRSYEDLEKPQSQQSQRASSRDLMPPPVPRLKPHWRTAAAPVKYTSPRNTQRPPNPRQSVQVLEDSRLNAPERGAEPSLPFRPSLAPRLRTPGQQQEQSQPREIIYGDQPSLADFGEGHTVEDLSHLSLRSSQASRGPFRRSNESQGLPTETGRHLQRPLAPQVVHYDADVVTLGHQPRQQGRRPLQPFSPSQLNHLSQPRALNVHSMLASQSRQQPPGALVSSPFFGHHGVDRSTLERPPTRGNFIQQSYPELARDLSQRQPRSARPQQPSLNGLSFIERPHGPSNHQPLYHSPYHIDDARFGDRRSTMPQTPRDSHGLLQRPDYLPPPTASYAPSRLQPPTQRGRITLPPSSRQQATASAQDQALSQIRGVRGASSQGAHSKYGSRPGYGPVQSSVLGFPRMGKLRDLKKATEAYWGGKLSKDELLAEGKRLRLEHWKIQKNAGVDVIPSNDFAYYDHVLDHIQMFNAIPERYSKHGLHTLDEYFAMGRGHQKDGIDVPSLEMVKWFDSNYHYVKPTLQDSQTFKLSDDPKPIRHFKEAKDAGIVTRPVILGPVSFLHLGKADRNQTVDPISLLEKLLPVYEELLKQLKSAGAETVQIDEPVLVFDLPAKIRSAFKPAYEKLTALQGSSGPQLVLTTYFGDVVHNLDVVKSSLQGTYAFHVDLVRNPEQLDKVMESLGPKQVLSAGVVDGRNIWKNNMKKSIEIVESAIQKLGKERVIVGTSSSLLHTPHTLESEKNLDAEVRDWFAFASEKTKEVAIIAKAVTDGPDSVRSELDANAKSLQSRATSKRTNNPDVKKRQEAVTKEMHERKSGFPTRYDAQKKQLNLPLFPTTTIGSFPQTKDIRIMRNKFTKGEITPKEYEEFIEKEIRDVVAIQDELQLDVYVHGEPERNDMVQYFGERLDGYVFTTHAWVQSYGSRCVRPPIMVGDVSRPAPMTVKESKYAASVSKKPMKGMLTGPITCLRWSFPRDDVHQSVQAQQLALALRDEVVDLEKAGIYVIQVDEPALREGLPLRAGSEREKYLSWAVDSFKLSTAGVEDSTQIHSHFCYSEFQDFFHAIAALDADVLSIENSKSDAKLLKVFIDEAYPRHIGPGVYDIHSPRVPSEQEIKDRVAEMLQYLKPDQLWVNPDCGLKTRGWKETKEALSNMVAAAQAYRQQHSKSA